MYAYMAEENIEQAYQLTDEIVQKNFGFKSVSELRKHSLDEMIRHRIYEEVLQHVLDDSSVDILNNNEYQSYIENVLQKNAAFAEAFDVTLEEYLETEYQMTLEEYEEFEAGRFRELFILSTILEQENQGITLFDVEEEWRTIAAEENMTVEEAKELLLEEDVEYSVVSKKFYEFVLVCYKNQIQQACSEMHEKFGLG